jgi:hypothetical protein
VANAPDATSDGGYGASGGLTWSHTCTGSTRILFVGAFGATDSDSITGITYNGVALTKIGSILPVAGSRYITLWYLVAPATGANNIVISVSGGDCGGVAASYSGPKQTGVPDASATNSQSSGTSLTGTVTTVADNCWLIAAALAEACAAGAGTTKRQDWALNSGMALFDSNGPITPAGSASLIVTHSNSPAGIVIASFAPDTGGGGGGNPWNAYAQQARRSPSKWRSATPRAERRPSGLYVPRGWDQTIRRAG